jgi:hypothetical protein
LQTEQITEIAELKEQYGNEEGKYIRWQEEIKLAKQYQNEYMCMASEYVRTFQNKTLDQARANVVTAKYDESTSTYAGLKDRFNVLYSNIETLRPLIFSNLPVPQIRRRNIQQDNVSGTISTLLERAVSCTLDKEDAVTKIAKARDDFLIVKKGVVRVGFEQEIIKEEQEQEVMTDTGEVVIEKSKKEMPGEKKVTLDYVPWDDLLIQPARQWEDVDWIAFRHEFTKDEFKAKFGARKAKNVTFNKTKEVGNYNDSSDTNAAVKNGLFRTCEVWEIWDKTERKIIFYTESAVANKVIKETPDFYGFDDFWCIPKPLGIESGINSIIPIPDYTQYKAQAQEISFLSQRISALIEQVRVAGLYDAVISQKDIQNFLSNDDGVFSPVKNIATGERISDKIYFKEIQPIVDTLVALYQQRQQAIAIVEQISGVSDLVRGSTNAEETATAQRIKGNFAISRIQPQQKEVQHFCRDLVRLIAQLYSANWTVEELAYISGMEIIDLQAISQEIQTTIVNNIASTVPMEDLPDDAQEQVNQQVNQAIADQLRPYEKMIKENKAIDAAIVPEIDEILKNDSLREYRIDIETDSTIQIDKERRQAEAMEIVNTMTDTANKLFPIVQAGGISQKAYKALLAYQLKQLGAIEEIENIILDEEDDNQPSQAEIAQQQAQEQAQQLQMAEMQLKDREVAVKEDKNQVDREKIAADLAKNENNAERDFALQQGQATRDFLLEKEKTIRDMELEREKQFKNA